MIKFGKNREQIKVLFPALFFDKYHSDGKLYIDIGLLFWNQCYDMNIEISDKKK